MKQQYNAPTVKTFSSEAILAKLGPANAVYP
jgi:hypothetical protein